MNAKRIATAAIALALVSQAARLRAGGLLETFDITGNRPSPIAGQILARIIPIRWDTRMVPVKYAINSTLNPIPNPLGPAFLTLADARTALQSAFDEWNEIPTSFIRMDITGTTANAGLAGFDFKNEVTFRTAASFTAVASSPSTALIRDTTVVNGDDIDGDGDSDVSNTITTAADVDNDGDIEMPAGFYKAGTILDNDVQFNTKASNGLRFTVEDAQADTVTRSVDLMGTAVHEFGHSFGLSHTIDNQIGRADGTGSTMFPIIDTGDPAAELSMRTLGSDDIAWASFAYPEGTQKSGPAALQPGDVAFVSVYGLITGEVRHGVLNEPILGGNVAARRWQTGEFVASGFSGTVDLTFNPLTGVISVIPDPAVTIVNGRYLIPAPKGQYAVSVEAVDGTPVAPANISVTAQIGAAFGQLNFQEEFFNTNKEGAAEIRPGQATNVVCQAGRMTDGVDITTNQNININNFGPLSAMGFINLQTGFYYAVRVPAAQFVAAIPAGGGTLSLHSILFETHVVDASTVPVFADAMLARGSVSADLSTATIDLADPLERTASFVGQDGDFAPFYLKNGHELARQVLREIEEGTLTDLFLVLRLPPGPFPGISNQPPLVGIATTAPFGFSYQSFDGITFTRRTTLSFRFSLGMTVVQ